ncbi:hypothetical protein VTN02DRAFT_475 [Thermoascus thermophilus]
MTLEMGNLTFTLSVGGTPIGQSRLPNVLLRPGANHVPMRATVNESLVLAMVTGTGGNASNASNASHSATGTLPLTITGASSVYRGREIPYFTRALAANPITVDLDVGRALEGIGLGGLSLSS